MKKKVIVLSLGGSLIIPDKVDSIFLHKFKKTLQKHKKNYKFIVVCGGGSIARKYISALEKEGLNERLQNFSGISATRMNARFMSYFFGLNPEKGIPHKMKEIKKYLKNQEVVFCGGLEYKPNQTSDSTAAQIAKKFKANFINLTDVSGLYDSNPKKNKNAKSISRITWKNFLKKANEIKYAPGQHFVLDQTAAVVIMKYKIKTYILGQNLKNLEYVLKNKSFKGTLISG